MSIRLFSIFLISSALLFVCCGDSLEKDNGQGSGTETETPVNPETPVEPETPKDDGTGTAPDIDDLPKEELPDTPEEEESNPGVDIDGLLKEDIPGKDEHIYQNTNPPLPVGKEKIKILFIGNSFTMDATEHLPGILNAAGIDNITMTRVYHGGYTLPEYNSNYTVDDICTRADYSPGDAEWRFDSGVKYYAYDTSLQAVLESTDDWDIITLQEHTGNSAAWFWPGTLKYALEGLISKIYANQPDNRPVIMYLMSQAYGTSNTTVLPSFESQDKMYAHITGIVRQIMSDTIIDKVIPSGTYLQNLRTTSVNIDNGMDLTRDSYHMDYGISRYGAACTVFESIIGPCTGKTLEGNTYRYDKADDDPEQYSTPVTDANYSIAIKAAQTAVETPFEVTNLSHL